MKKVYIKYLRFLNLSNNFIEIIEMKTFNDQEKLLVLDLNFNRLIQIQNNVFSGLSLLKDLHLVSKMQFNLNDESFMKLDELKTIYLSDSAVENYSCLLMRVFNRINHVEKFLNRSYGKIVYFRSLFIMAQSNFHSEQLDDAKIFHFLQSNIHLNLKEEFQIESFYEKLSKYKMKDSLNFNFIKNFGKCSNVTFNFSTYFINSKLSFKK